MGRTKNFSEDIEKKVIYNYTQLNQGLQTAGKEFGVSQYMVEKILKKYQIPKRTYTEAKQAGRKYPCNDNFFKTPSSDMAYVLGLIAADGNVAKKENRITIELQEEDGYILQQIADVTQTTRPVKKYFRKHLNKNTCIFSNWSHEWKQDLAKYGIVPNKTFRLTPPTLLPQEYRIDYIRGYFDGDGSINITPAKNGKNVLYNKNAFEISGASKKEMDWLYQELVIHYGIILNKPGKDVLDNGVVMYKFLTGDKKEIQKIYNLFYHKDTSLFLKRKKEKFETILKIPRDSNSY